MKKKLSISFLLIFTIILSGCTSKDATEIKLSQTDFYSNSSGDIVLEGTSEPQIIDYQVLDEDSNILVESTTEESISDIVFEAPEIDGTYTLVSGEIETEINVYSIETTKAVQEREKEMNAVIERTIQPLQYWRNGKEIKTSTDWFDLTQEQKIQYITFTWPKTGDDTYMLYTKQPIEKTDYIKAMDKLLGANSLLTIRKANDEVMTGVLFKGKDYFNTLN